MELIELILKNIHPFESLGSAFMFIFVVLCTTVQISPIKINPWDTMLGWIGDRFNSGIKNKIDKIDQRVDKMEKRIDEHVDDSSLDKVKRQRQYLIEFVNEGVNGNRHTKESFENALRVCDEYEEYVKKHDIKNGVINSTIHAIKSKYEEHLLKADFATEEMYVEKRNMILEE